MKSVGEIVPKIANHVARFGSLPKKPPAGTGEARRGGVWEETRADAPCASGDRAASEDKPPMGVNGDAGFMSRGRMDVTSERGAHDG